MQLKIRHTLSEELVLPLSYHHIIQSIIYRGLADESGYSRHMHNSGYAANKANNVGRRYKLFNFSLLRGNYRVMNRQIIFSDYVEWEIRSPDIYMMRLLESAFRKNGIHYGNQHFSDVALRLMNETVEKDSIHIRMLSPICLYSTNKETKKTYFYSPEEEAFSEQVNDNFIRKYTACYGIPPDSGIKIEPVNVRRRDKYVTKYKEFYLSGWLGEYQLTGERKYLDFLYQTGLGSRNAQGFGMFEESPDSQASERYSYFENDVLGQTE